MNKLRQKFSELRKNTPRRVQWLLLGAAFVVVLILLTILLGGKKDNKEEIAQIIVNPTELQINPDMINWADVIVGEKKEQKVSVHATAPVVISGVEQIKNEQNDEVNRFISTTTTCMGQSVDENIGCDIIISYAPGTPMGTKQTSIVVKWHKPDEAEDMTRTEKIVLTVGAVAPAIPEKKVEEPEPLPVPAPVAETEVETETEAEEEVVEAEDEPETIQQEIVREIETIAPSVTIAGMEDTKKPKKEIVIPDGCSDFAFPAYNNSGRQIGWVKPSGGAYYYHTFADKNCTEPAGTYNPDNGIITDDSGKKIGTDSDHIGASAIDVGTLPELSNVPAIKPVHRASQNDTPGESGGMGKLGPDGIQKVESKIEKAKETGVIFGTTDDNVVTSSAPYDRTFILRQFKPIPATIVSDIRADINALQMGVPVRATVDRNVYSDNGRTVIIPTGTLLLGYVHGEVPGPYKTIGRMQVKWYQFIRPDGVEFNFPGGNDPYSADSQGRLGVPGRGSSDYLEQFFMPMLTAFVPAAINLINPVADAFVNQIDLDNNTVVQSGTMRSSELAKNEIITAWNQVAQKLMVDMMDNTVPPFTIAAGTRITVYSPVDLQITCGKDAENAGKKCAVAKFDNGKRRTIQDTDMGLYPADDSSWVGQSRQFQVGDYCERNPEGLWRVKEECSGVKTGKLNACGGYSYSTLKLWCDSLNYESKKALQYDVYRKDQEQQYQNKVQELGGKGSQAFNEQILGVQYNEDGTVQNPYASAPEAAPEAAAADVLLCLDGTAPDANGCCTGEIYTDMGEQGFNCCPEAGGDCFPPML